MARNFWSGSLRIAIPTFSQPRSGVAGPKSFHSPGKMTKKVLQRAYPTEKPLLNEFISSNQYIFKERILLVKDTHLRSEISFAFIFPNSFILVTANYT